MNKQSVKESIRNIVEYPRWHETEYSAELQVICSYIQIWGMSVYLYGGGRDTYHILSFLKAEDITVVNVVDNDERKEGRKVLGVSYISTKTFLAQNTKRDNVFMFISPVAYFGTAHEEIVKFLCKAGISHFSPISARDRRIITGVYADRDHEREDYYSNNLCVIDDFVDLLEDEQSLEIFREYIRTYCENDIYRLKSGPMKYKYFYGHEGEIIWEHRSNEIWLNFGANVGDTLFAYIRNGLPFEKIYAIEGDSRIFNDLCSNLQKLPLEYREKIIPVQRMIDRNSDLDFLKDKAVTFINADIEGAELEMLFTLQDVIKENRPVIAICLYHKKEDIHDIPSFFQETVTDYKFYLRKYSSTSTFRRENYEIVLYAVPDERAH